MVKVVILVDATVAMACENDMSVMRKKALAKYWSYTNNLMHPIMFMVYGHRKVICLNMLPDGDVENVKYMF